MGLTLLFMLLGVCQAVFAQKPLSVEVMDYEKGQVALTIEAPANAEVSIMIFNPGAAAEDLISDNQGDLLGKAQFYKQIRTDAEGKYTEMFTLREVVHADNLPFTIFVTSANGQEKEELYYYFGQKRADVIAQLNALAVDSPDKIPVLSDAAKAFGLTQYPPFSGVQSKVAMADKLIEIRRENGDYTETEPSRPAAELKQAAVLSAIEEGWSGLYSDDGHNRFSDALELEQLETIDTLYREKISSAGLWNLNQKLSNERFTNRQDFYTKFSEQAVYCGMLFPVTNGYGHITELLKDTQIKNILSANGFDDAVYQKSKKNTVAAAVMKQNPDTLEALVRLLNETARKNPADSSSGSGNSGGNASGGFGGGGASGSGVSDGGSLPAATPAEQVLAEPFDDLEQTPWARESILALYALGAINGKTQNTFAPMDFITREEFVKILTSAFALTDEKAVCEFDDIAKDRWSYTYIASGYKNGIINGKEEGVFAPEDLITVEEMAVMCHRTAKAAGKQMKTEHVIPFVDSADISAYALEDVTALQTNGILVGDETGALRPKSNASRAQAAKVLYMLLSL